MVRPSLVPARQYPFFPPAASQGKETGAAAQGRLPVDVGDGSGFW
jgi:hypothetical protein